MNAKAAAEKKPTFILVLQGGGAMAAYQVGAYAALREAAFEPEWICGISMGAINGAIIAGNAPERRLERLDTFWDIISRPSLLPSGGGVTTRTFEHFASYATALTLGQPGFFVPRPINPYLAAPGVAATSFYDTAPLYRTLADVLEIDRLKRNELRLSVGVTDVEAGTLAFFDTTKLREKFCPAHVIASGSLPPGFPATMVDGKSYWDGGCVSNSPLQAVEDDMPAGHTVVFVIDLWSATGLAPETISDVDWRSKQIRYASITPVHVSALAAKVKLRNARHQLGLPHQGTSPERLDIVHIIYQPSKDQISASDAEFSRSSIAERRAAGIADMRRALGARPWRRPEQTQHLGCLVHRVTDTEVRTLGDE